MFHLGVPVIDQHDLTRQLLDSLAATVSDPSGLHVVVIDNGSSRPYRPKDIGHQPFQVSLHKVLKTAPQLLPVGPATPTNPAKAELLPAEELLNLGYYRPIWEVAKWATEADLIGLCHNDLIFYEVGWDLRLRQEFVHRRDLGMVGLCGSNQIDELGGRGSGTMCWFRGERGQPQSAGRRIRQLAPALILDSLFMAMRRPVLDALDVDEHTPLCHFVDKIWPLRTIKHGWKVGVLGVEIDHLGGMTAVGDNRFPEDARQWCLQEGVDPGSDPALALYLEAERRFLAEARRMGMLPATI
jgi:hypothetical protein